MLKKNEENEQNVINMSEIDSQIEVFPRYKTLKMPIRYFSHIAKKQFATLNSK